MEVRQLDINSAIYTILLNIHLVASTVKVQWAWYSLLCYSLPHMCVYIVCILRFQPPWGPASLQYLIMQAQTIIQLYFRYSFELNSTPRCS